MSESKSILQHTVQDDSNELLMRNRQQAAIVEFGHLALNNLNLSELMDKVAELLINVFNCDYSKVLQLLPDNTKLLFQAGVGWKPGIVGHTIISANKNFLAGYALHTNSPVIFDDLKTEARFTSPDVMFDHGIVSGIHVIVPLENSSYGVLGTCSKTHRIFSPEDISFLQAIANTLGQALERKRIETDKIFLGSIVETSEDSIVTINFDRIITSWNKSAEELYGYTASDAIGKHLEMLMLSEDIKKLWSNVDRIKHNKEVEIYDTLRIKKNGKLLALDIALSPVKDANGKVIGVSTIARDITQRKLTEEALRLSEERYRTLVQQVEDYAIFGLDVNGGIISWNEGVEKILGYSEKDIIGKHVSIVFTPEDREKNVPERELQTAMDSGQSVSERMHIKKNGTRFFATDLMTATRDESGALLGFSKVMRDISERKKAQDTIEHQSLHDTLTGLPNRKSLEERLSFAINIAARNRQILAVMFLDLDRFKNINDTLGHGIGDIILREVAARFEASVRKEDTAARLGGDEFIIMLTEINSAEDAIVVAEKILHSMETAIKIGKYTLHISTSIGIALYPFDGEDADILLRNADTALYRAKESGRNQHKMYNQGMNVYASERLILENELREALA
nr:diguanylate cyclase [bacterium]